MRENGGNAFARLFVVLAIVVVVWLLTTTGCNDHKEADRRPPINYLATSAMIGDPAGRDTAWLRNARQRIAEGSQRRGWR